ncbi:MAG: hypothetical protein ACI83N_000582 [Hydrogenophaga sp.]|jgi:hypothetical protein
MHPSLPPSRSRLPLLIVVLVLLSTAGYFGWPYLQRAQQALTEAQPALAPSPPVSPAAPPELANAPAVPPAIEYPVESPASDSAALPALGESDALLSERLAALLGRKNLLGFLQLDGFVRRAVATVDNLPRSQAPSSRWPVNPTPQRFLTRPGPDGRATIAPENSQRYPPLVQMLESVDSANAVALYRSLYPLFQSAYEELGFPDRYFNDRLVNVLDHLIATPVPTQPLAVTLVEVKGSVPSLRPWVRYEYVDPTLEAMSAGQKMLMRTGPDHQKRLQAKLRDIRQRVALP